MTFFTGCEFSCRLPAQPGAGGNAVDTAGGLSISSYHRNPRRMFERLDYAHNVEIALCDIHQAAGINPHIVGRADSLHSAESSPSSVYVI